jgi:hypothetical protein
MKQLTLTTVTGTVAYDLASLAPLPAIKAGCLTFKTRAGMEVSVPAADVLEFAVGTAPRLTKADRLKQEVAASLSHLDELRAQVHEAANASIAPEDATFTDALEAYAEAVQEHGEQQTRTLRYIERRAETERKRATSETKPRTKKSAPAAPVETTPTPKAKRAKK